MKLFYKVFFILISIYLIKAETEAIEELSLINFTEKEGTITISGKSKYRIPATFNKDNNSEKYLYMYPININKKGEEPNKAAFKLYFKEFEESDTNYNYLECDYSTLELNSGLFIKIKDLNYVKANIFIIGYENLNFIFIYKIVDKITFPKFYQYSNFQLNQFKLPQSNEEKEIIINFTTPYIVDDYLFILSKTSLRKFDIKVTYDNDMTDTSGRYLFPNGFSIYLNREIYTDPEKNIEIKITNKNNIDEIIILGYMHLIENNIFPNPLFNGMQLYLEGNSSSLEYLTNSATSGKYQHFTYQSFCKDLKITFVDKNDYNDQIFYVTNYNSMFQIDVDCSDKIRFDFDEVKERSSLYFQYLDYTKNEITQKLNQILVTGNPKSILLPGKKSLYHFLPIEGYSQNIKYYLRAKSPGTLFVSFKSCYTYPECTFSGKGEENLISPFINNIGLWYSQPISEKELQIIYIYCENECSYDILMTYDNDPLFLFPDNNYTKFIGENNKDSFMLPVFEYLSNNETIKIDFTVISGKGNVELSFYNGRNGDELKFNYEKNGRSQSYVIKKDTFMNSNYYTKDIYIVVEGNKNILYNIKYMNVFLTDKSLENNRVIEETLNVAESGKESESIKSFTFTNYYDKPFYISVVSNSCKSKVLINDEEETAHYHLIQKSKKGLIVVKIYLINDGNICIKGFEETITLFAFSSNNPNILISENNLVNITLNVTELSFTHLFRPNQDNKEDNSFVIEIEKLSKSLTFSYTLETIYFNTSEKNDLNLSKPSYTLNNQSINFTKNFILNSEQIKKHCDNLNENQVCSLTMKFASLDKSQFSLFLSKNVDNYVRQLTDKTLISSVNTKSIKYYYIDLDRNHDTEVQINSYGQDLEIDTKFYSGNKNFDEVNNLPSSFKSIPNYYQFTQTINETCGTFCKLYIAIRLPEDKYKRELFTTFSINYLLKNSEKSSYIFLPFNFFAQYEFSNSDLKIINYYSQTFEKTNINIELTIIKKNEKDNSVVTAQISGNNNLNKELNSTEGLLNIPDLNGEFKIKITYTGENKPTYKLKLSSSGLKSSKCIVPILSSYSEKCNSKFCLYSLDITQDNMAEYAYFYVPETEGAIISIQSLNYSNSINSFLEETSNYQYNSDEEVKRTNWCQYKINRQYDFLLIRVLLPKIQEVNLLTSFYNHLNLVTLNNEEKRIFTISNSDLDIISFNISNSESSNNKYKINLHAIRGNGIFKINEESYPLGLEANYKEEISIIVDSESLNNLIETSNKKDDDYDKRFIFAIDYIIVSINLLSYEIKEFKINSFKFYQKEKLNDISFYMKANKTDTNIYKNVSMNIKIYSNLSNYDINTYIVDEDFIKKIINNENVNKPSSVGTIKTFIKGGTEKGELTLAKLDISSQDFNSDDINENSNLYVYINFTQNNDNCKNVKIDLYPYDISYKIYYNPPLARNELFIQKLPSNIVNYQLLLTKSDFGSSKNIKIDYIRPLSDIYEIAIKHEENNTIEFPQENETDLINDDEKDFYFGKEQIFLETKNRELLNLLFNFKTKNRKQQSDEKSYIFKYRYDSKNIFEENTKEFDVEGSVKNVTFKVDAATPLYTTGRSVLIISAYKKSDIKIEIPELKYLSIYLLFSDISPYFTMYKIVENRKVNEKTSRSYYTTEITDKTEYYFTCVAIIQDNEREEYLGYEAKLLELDSYSLINGILDYMKNHIFATVIIIIIILFIIGIMINICRSERKRVRITSHVINDVEGPLVEGKVMDDK